MNTEPKELWASRRVGLPLWRSFNEEDRERYVTQVRAELAAKLARELLNQKYIVAHDSVFRFDCDEPFVQLSASIRVGYIQHTVWGGPLTMRELARELWARFWRALW